MPSRVEHEKSFITSGPGLFVVKYGLWATSNSKMKM